MIKKMNIIALIAFVFAGTSFANAMEREEDAYDPFRPGMLDNHNLYDDNTDREGRIQTNQEERNRAIIWLEQAADHEMQREATEWLKKAEQEEYNRALRSLEQKENQNFGTMDLNISKHSKQQKNNITQ